MLKKPQKAPLFYENLFLILFYYLLFIMNKEFIDYKGNIMKNNYITGIGIFFVMAVVCLNMEQAQAGSYDECMSQCNISNRWANNRTYNSCRANCHNIFQ